jgi:LTXXQ motif family protein
MFKVSARLIVVALVFVAFSPPPQDAKAFGFRLGPLNLAVPFPGFHRHGRTTARSEPNATEPTQANRPTLLYPVLALPALDDAILSPGANRPWPFGYETIFDQAFAKYPDELAAELCPFRNTAGEIVMGIEHQTAATAAQKPLLEKLAVALGQASGYLVKSCPKEIPLQPIARLQLMESQIDAMIMALEIVRPPLEKFERSLDDKQRARWDAAAAAAGSEAAHCNSKADAANWPLAQLEQAVQPTDAQRKLLADVEDAFKRAASGLAADCADAVPQTASGRLAMTEDRLDATWRAVQTIEVALANFQKDLSDEQKARINALEIASAR